jgi:hypothetical protein
MSDVAQELAALVADTLAAVESWRATGAVVAPVGPLVGLPAAEPWPETPPAAAPVAGRPAPPPSFGPPRPRAPAPPPAPVPAPRAATAEPRRASPSPAAVPPPLAAAPPPPAPAAGAGLAGLFAGKWQAALRDRGAELTTVLAELAPCADCGVAPTDLRGSGRADAALVVLTGLADGAQLGPDGGAMLDRMLLNVLAVERGDVWLVEANACAARGGGCKSAVRRQVDIVAPRLVLAMGAGATGALGVKPAVRGEWTPWGSADVMPTFHPLELLSRQGDKRPAMEHLTLLRQRL